MNPEVEQAVSDLEALIGATLPADYRAFLLRYGGDDLNGKSYWLPHPKGAWIESVEQCYWVDLLLEDMMPPEMDLRRQGLGEFAPGLLPIADNGCGDTVLLSCREQDYGAVHHLFHEEGKAGDYSAGLYLLAPTFTEWLAQIEAFQE